MAKEFVSIAFYWQVCSKVSLLVIEHNYENLTSTKKEVLVTSDYLGKSSLQVKKQLKDVCWSCRKNVKLNVVFILPKRVKTKKFYISLSATLTEVFTMVRLNKAY